MGGGGAPSFRFNYVCNVSLFGVIEADLRLDPNLTLPNTKGFLLLIIPILLLSYVSGRYYAVALFYI